MLLEIFNMSIDTIATVAFIVSFIAIAVAVLK